MTNNRATSHAIILRAKKRVGRDVTFSQSPINRVNDCEMLLCIRVTKGYGKVIKRFYILFVNRS